ncbi:hypothetical protein SAMN06265370_13425 [Puniceibacterium sediminis]|uniref:Uncharacterized protein n=1 Tax=Puniceibacterium sediminis TaxID=1608407 RepID=A0A238ZNA6_9RHOB|nr:hypothetical protein SAMN06265370_13425 [Puniceibacterium sediminis]
MISVLIGIVAAGFSLMLGASVYVALSIYFWSGCASILPILLFSLIRDALRVRDPLRGSPPAIDLVSRYAICGGQRVFAEGGALPRQSPRK